MPTISETLATFAHQLRPEQVPPEVNERARHLILDAIGCALAARGEAFATTLANATRALSPDTPGASGVIGFTERLPLRDAAMLNGMLAHGLDYDDTHMAGIVHLTVSVLPTLLALCGQRRSDGATLLAPTSPRSRPARASRAPRRAACMRRAFTRPAWSVRSRARWRQDA